jgi:antitoxin MazE
MKARIHNLGDDLVLEIPPDIAAQLGFTDGAEVETYLELGRLVVYPPGQRRYTVEELLEGVTDDQLHPEVDTGPPVGREIL